MAKIKQYEQLELFEFGVDEEGKYVNFSEEEHKKLELLEKQKYPDFSYQEIVGHEIDINFKLIAYHFLNIFSQYKKSLEDIRSYISSMVKTRCYHYANFKKNLFIYSYKYHDDPYDNVEIYIEIDNFYINPTIHGPLDDILLGKEKICFPACSVKIYERLGDNIELITGLYANGKNFKEDIRYKILCDKLKCLEYGSNRINPNKRVKDFYEVEFTIQDFIKFWGESEK